MDNRLVIDAIKERVRLETLFEGLVSAGSNFRAICPFHDDHKPSLHINVEKGTYKCFACQAGGDVITFIQESEGVGFAEAITVLAERAGISLDQPIYGGRPKTQLYNLCREVADRYRRAYAKSRAAQRYVESRGISVETSEMFGIGLAAPDCLDGLDPELLKECGIVRDDKPVDRLLGRLIFPIRDFMGRPIAFGGRISPSKEKELREAGYNVSKYVNTPETRLFKKGSTLYGADLARKHSQGEVYVVEGYMDVIGQHQRGVRNVVGIMSASLTQGQLSLIRRLSPRAVLVFDGDKAGLEAAERALPLFLASSLDVEIITLSGGDPGDQDIAGLPRIDPLEYAIGRIVERQEDTPEGLRRAADEFARLVSHVPKIGSLPIKVEKAVQSFAERVGIDPKFVTPLIQSKRPAPVSAPTYDPLDLELLTCLVNDEDLVEEARGVCIPRDEFLKPMIEAIYAISESEVPTIRAILGTIGDGRDFLAKLVGEGEWSIRGKAVVRAYRMRAAREEVERLKTFLASCSDAEKPEVRQQLVEAIKILNTLDRNAR